MAEATTPLRTGGPAGLPVPPLGRRAWRTLRPTLAVLWMAATAGFLVLTAMAIAPKITWYLAVDQFGYLTFARDLLAGRVFHRWPPLAALGPQLASPVDVLSQTYVWDHGRLYCRYAPGFPLLLAAWTAVFGEGAAHYLNATVFIALLAVVMGFTWRLWRSPWRALACAVLVVLCPTSMYLWALTPVRDLPTHLFGLLGLLLLVGAPGRGLGPGRCAAAGAALGFAASIRPENVLYALPAVLLAAARWRREHEPRPFLGLSASALGMALGLAPFLLYNYAATGHPLRPTQGMEIGEFVPAPAAPAGPGRVGFPPPAWRGGTTSTVQGGGLRLENFSATFPGNLLLLRLAYGDALLAVALWGVVVAAFLRRRLALVAVTYSASALVLYSFWSRPEARYLIGLYLFVPMLIVEGTLGSLDLVRHFARRRGVATALGASVGAIFLVMAAAAMAIGRGQGLGLPLDVARVLRNQAVLPTITTIVLGVAGVAACCAAVWPHRRVAAVAAPALALALLTLSSMRALSGLEVHARFQAEELATARATFAAAVVPRAVVITTEDVGRPAEGIEYYSGVAHALYLTDLARWRLPLWQAAFLLTRAGFVPYLLLPTAQPGRAQMMTELEQHFDVDVAASIPPERSIDYFVAAAFYPKGVEMELLRLTLNGPRWRERVLTPRAAQP